MSDGIALPGLALLAIGLVALAMVWPQGQGAHSPPPFGHRVAAIPAPTISDIKSAVTLRGPEALPTPAPRRAPHPAP
jgi:hypothetical protein